MCRKSILIIFLIFIYCGSESQSDISALQENTTGQLVLELTFGDKELPDEFLLANPSGLAVRDNGDILVTDEGVVKVCDKNGKNKEIIGKKGEGPDEFLSTGVPTIGPTGLLGIIDRNTINIYSKDNEYVDRIDLLINPNYKNLYEKSKIRMFPLYSSVILDDRRKLVNFSAFETSDRSQYPMFDFLVMDHSDSIIVLRKFTSKSNIEDGTTNSGIMHQGDLWWAVSPGEKIVYSHTAYDKSSDDGISFYTLNILYSKHFISPRINTGIHYPQIRTC